MKKIVEYFIPEKYKGDLEYNRKSKFVIWFLFIVTLISLFFSTVIYISRPEEILNIVIAPTFLLVFGFTLWIFKRTGAFLLVTHIIGVFFVLGMAGMPAETGGIFSPDMPTVYIIPIFALIMGNLLAGFIYAFLMYVIIFGFYFAEVNGVMDFRSTTNKLPSDYYLFNLALNAFGILFLVFRNEVLRLRGVKELRESHELINLKNKEITDSINYARKIQSAILPQQDYVKKLLPDSFFFYQPKDIVSGDFYWVAERNGEIFVVVADCTGHGVPGAFMSVVGMNLLNEIVNHRGITSPSEILGELNNGVVDALQQRETASNDGMDIALVKINFANKKIEYTAANRSMILFRNGVIEEIKPTKNPIGGFNSLKEKHFETHQIQLSSGDIVYLSTDGYADQFGGEQDKKITTKNFRRLLEKVSSLSMQDQEKELSRFINDWKTGYEQTDDILVAGIKI